MSAIVTDRDPRWAALEKQTTVAITGATRSDRRVDRAATVATGATNVRRSDGGAWLSAILPTLAIAIAAPLELARAPIDRFNQVEDEFLALFAAAAPETWSSTRRDLSQVLASAHGEVRRRERRRSGDPS